MASASSMPQSSLKQSSISSDPYPKSPQSDLFDTIFNQSIVRPWCSYAPPSSPNSSRPTKRLVRKRSYTESLDERYSCLLTKPLFAKQSSIDERLKMLLKNKLVYAIQNGKPFETIQFHREQLVEELIRWILPSIEMPDEYNSFYREQLLTLLCSASKKTVQDVPADNASWFKLLMQWIKRNGEASREIYKILAVDGFYGYELKNLPSYMTFVLCTLRKEYKLHAIGVRAMYDFFDENCNIESLMGVDSACAVFLALLDMYCVHLDLSDDQERILINAAKTKAEGFLQQRKEQFPDLKHVHELRRPLINVYREQFGDGIVWKEVGKNLLKNLQITDDKK